MPRKERPFNITVSKRAVYHAIMTRTHQRRFFTICITFMRKSRSFLSTSPSDRKGNPTILLLYADSIDMRLKKMKNEENMYSTTRSQRVCFRPCDDVYDLPFNLVQNDNEFIKIANIVLRRMQRLKKNKTPSIFDRAFHAISNVSSSTTQDDHLMNSNDRDVLTADTLKKFKRALMIRLEDESSPSSQESPTSYQTDRSNLISSLISRVIRCVDEVGWPRTDDHLVSKEEYGI